MPEYIYDVSEAGSTFKRMAELVRCKDCDHWKLTKYIGGEGMACECLMSFGAVFTDEDDFCSNGVWKHDSD